MANHKVLTVSSEVQRAVFLDVLLGEISHGFWKGARPSDHAESWKGVDIIVGTDLGAKGFDVPRNYNFVNPEFFSKNETKLLEAALAADPATTVKSLKKHLISLNQIIGSRLTEIGGIVAKLPRGRKQSPTTTITTTKKSLKTTTRKAIANFVDPDSAVEMQGSVVSEVV